MIDTEFIHRLPRCSLERGWRSPDGSDDHGAVVARWDDGPVLEPDYLCKPCLDIKMDFADDIGGYEPTALTWVMTETQHWCGRHWWPALLCDGWPHGPGYNAFGQRWSEVEPPLIADLATRSRRRHVPMPRMARDLMVEPWQVGQAAPERPCWCRRPTCTGCSPV